MQLEALRCFSRVDVLALVMREIDCCICGKHFETTHGNKLTCSLECGKVHRLKIINQISCEKARRLVEKRKLDFRCEECGGPWKKETPVVASKVCSHKCALSKRSKDRAKKAENPEWMERQRRWRVESWHRRKMNEPDRHRELVAKRKLRPQWKIAHRIRNRLREALLGRRLSDSTAALLGCSYDFFKSYIESKFTGSMSWDNWGEVWELDHIQPVASFDQEDEAQRKLCWNWQNFQPLPKKRNREKCAKITVPQLHIPLCLAS
jgi:hypothetical protein